MFIGAGPVAARWYIGNNDKKEIKHFVLSAVFTALALTAWFLVPALTPLLSIVLVPLIPYFLYSLYRLTKSIYYKHYNKQNKAHNANDTTIKALAVAASGEAINKTACRRDVKSLLDELQDEYVKNKLLKHLDNSAMYDSKKTFDLAMCVKQTEPMLNGLEQYIKDKFYNFILVSPNNVSDVLKLAENIEYIKSLMEGVRPSTRKIFYNHIIHSIVNTNGFYNSQDVVNLAKSIEEIDCIVSSITNTNLQDYFDQSFTITKMQNEQGRIELLESAIECKKINDMVHMQTRSHHEGPLPVGIIELTGVSNLVMAPPRRAIEYI